MSHAGPQQPGGRVRCWLLQLAVRSAAVLLGGMDVNLVTVLALLAVAVSPTSESK